MRKLFTIVLTTLLLISCGERGGKAVSSRINPADTINFFFSGVIDPNKHTFTDCSTAQVYKYDLGVQNSRAISSKIDGALQANTKDLYCKIKGRLIYDAPKNTNVLIIEDALSLTRLQGCDKPLLPNSYLSGNTYKESYVLTLNADYTYTLERDGLEIESGMWGKSYDYQGVMVWHNVAKNEKNVRTFTIAYLESSVIITMHYEDQYVIFS